VPELIRNCFWGRCGGRHAHLARPGDEETCDGESRGGIATSKVAGDDRATDCRAPERRNAGRSAKRSGYWKTNDWRTASARPERWAPGWRGIRQRHGATGRRRGFSSNDQPYAGREFGGFAKR